MEFGGHTNEVDFSCVNHRAGARAGREAITVPVFDRIREGPKSFPGFRVMAVEGFCRFDGVKVEELPVCENWGGVGFTACQLEDWFQSGFRKLFEERPFWRGAIVVGAKDARPFGDLGVFGEGPRCSVKFLRKLLGCESQGKECQDD
jgi:hypothetical protein